MSDEMTGGNEAASDVQTQSVEQAPAQAAPGTDQSGATAVDQNAIEFGGQKYKDWLEAGPAIKKSYEELQKGFTQATQRHALERKAWTGFAEWWRSNIGNDPAKRANFEQLVRSGVPQQQAAQIAAGQGAQQAPQQRPDTSVVDSLSEQMDRMQTQMEIAEFRGSHPDVSEDDMKEVAKFMLERLDGGERWSFEAAYRFLQYPKLYSRGVEAGQKTVEQAVAKGQKAGQVLGSTPATAQQKAPKPVNFFATKDPTVRHKLIKQAIKDANITISDEEE